MIDVRMVEEGREDRGGRRRVRVKGERREVLRL